MSTELADLIGARLVIGFPGTRVTDDVLRQFRETRAGGVIFYRINFEDPEQLRNVIGALEASLERKLLVCVDHEGGRVVMYRDGVTIFPDNLTVGHAGDPDLARRMGEIAAAELRALGTDVNFAPVLDVLTEAYSPNIGIRSYGKDWKQVAAFGAAYLRALQKGGVSATAKHFPGKGHAPVDAHLSLPTIPSTLAEMRAVHLRPFIEAIEAGVDVVMSSHPRYPKIDPDNIATFSRTIIHDLLRGELGYTGVIASDDLEMGAIREISPIGVAAVRAAAAGHDLLLSCHDYDSEREMFLGLLEAYKSKRLPLKELELSVERIEALKAKRKERFAGAIGPAADGPATARRIARAGARVLQDDNGLLPLSAAKAADVAVAFPRLSEFAPKIMIERAYEDETTAIHRILGPLAGRHTISLYGIQPSDDEIETASAAAAAASVVLLFCFDAHLYPAEKTLIERLQRSGTPLVAILMRDPYDTAFLRKEDAAVTAFGFRDCQIRAAVERVFGRDVPIQ